VPPEPLGGGVGVSDIVRVGVRRETAGSRFQPRAFTGRGNSVGATLAAAPFLRRANARKYMICGPFRKDAADMAWQHRRANHGLRKWRQLSAQYKHIYTPL
jgi:hypothetical protein